MKWRTITLAIIAIVLSGPSACEERTQTPAGWRMHPRAELEPADYPDSLEPPELLTPRMAAERAADSLLRMGGSEITVCRVTWIAAPLGGYLVDGTFSLPTDSARYTTFRVGVRDGSEGDPGEVFVKLLRGETTAGERAWSPPPGPDWVPQPGEMGPEGLLDYEFLLDRESFEALQADFEGRNR